MNYLDICNYYLDIADGFLKPVKTDCNITTGCNVATDCNVMPKTSKCVEADKNDKPVESPKTLVPVRTIPTIRNIGPNPKKNTVTVVFADGTKVVTKCNEADEFDINIGVALALAEKMFGSKNKYHKLIKEKLPKAKVPSEDMAELRAKQRDLEGQLTAVNKTIRKMRTGK